MQVLKHLKQPVKTSDLNLKNTLLNGQAFNWFHVKDDEYVGVVANLLIRMRSNQDDQIEYEVLNDYEEVEYVRYPAVEKQSKQKRLASALSHYFRLDESLPGLIEFWRKRDQYFNEVGTQIHGLRMLRQEPFECLISFLVSQNNNIKRITSNLLSIRSTYGTKLGTYDEKDYYRFPSLDQLAQGTVAQLREMGLGYRAEYIKDCTARLQELGQISIAIISGETYLIDLIDQPADDILDKLLEFKGVGRKVADCVRLFSLDCDEVVPVDTHVYQIYMNRYKTGPKKKVSASNYGEVQDLFRNKFGQHAGWAHSFLFTAELPQFKVTPPTTKSKKKSSIQIQEEEPIVQKKLQKVKSI